MLDIQKEKHRNNRQDIDCNVDALKIAKRFNDHKKSECTLLIGEVDKVEKFNTDVDNYKSMEATLFR